MREKAKLLDQEGIRRSLTRIAHEILEKNKGVKDLILVGIRRRGCTFGRAFGPNNLSN